MTIRVTKYDMRGKIIAETRVDTLPQAHAFLDSLDSEGNPKPVAKAESKPEASASESTVPG